MTTARTGHIDTESLECEHIPPLDLPETHGISWERQLEAVTAWQMAGGNVVDGAGEMSVAQRPWLLVERRRKAVIIDFPDRRLAA